MATALRALPLLILLLLLTGCGSSPLDSANSAVKTYDSAAQRDLASTGAACGTAAHDLSGDVPKIKEEDLRRAYSLAQQGFQDCATAAGNLNYRLMAQANAELARANTLLRRANGTKSG